MRKECYWYPVCPIKRFYEAGKIEAKWVLEYCKGDYSKCVRKRLEEQGIAHHDNMLPNGQMRKDLK